MQGLGDAEIDHLGHRHAIAVSDQNIGGFEIAVNHALLVRVLHGSADLAKQLKPRVERQMVPITVGRNRYTVHEFHDKIGPTARRGPRVQHACDVGVLHHRQGLALRVKPHHNLPGIQPRLENLECHLALHGCGLLGPIDQPHPAFAN